MSDQTTPTSEAGPAPVSSQTTAYVATRYTDASGTYEVGTEVHLPEADVNRLVGVGVLTLNKPAVASGPEPSAAS
jgi:hypothetical protein